MDSREERPRSKSGAFKLSVDEVTWNKKHRKRLFEVIVPVLELLGNQNVIVILWQKALPHIVFENRCLLLLSINDVCFFLENSCCWSWVENVVRFQNVFCSGLKTTTQHFAAEPGNEMRLEGRMEGVVVHCMSELYANNKA